MTHRSGWLIGVGYSVIHIVIAGIVMGVMPTMHPRMPIPIAPPGAFMSNLGVMGIVAVVMMHVIFGAIVGAMYGVVVRSRPNLAGGRPLASV